MNEITKHISRDLVFIFCVSLAGISLFGMLYKSTITRNIQRPLQALPMDQESLEQLGFFPLFSSIMNYEVDPLMIEMITADLQAQGLSADDINQQLAGLSPKQGLTYHVVSPETGAITEGLAPADAELIIPLGLKQLVEGENWGWNESFLMQYKCLNQFELAEKTGLPPALCAGHALDNAWLVQRYVTTGEIKYLMAMNDLEQASNFLLDLRIDDWISTQEVRNSLDQMKKLLRVNTTSISVISSAALLDTVLSEEAKAVLFDQQEYEIAQGVKETIRRGLRNKYFQHMIIVGNEESVESHGHYFAFAVVKVGAVIQYLVLDTLPNVYHLQEGSHEKKRLLYMIDQFEKGKSKIDFVNIRWIQYQKIQ